MCSCHKSAVCSKKIDGTLGRENKYSNDLINRARYATMNTQEGVVGVVFVLEMGGMWLSKVARRGVKSNVISKNFFRYCVGCEDLCGAWSFGFLRK